MSEDLKDVEVSGDGSVGKKRLVAEARLAHDLTPR